MKKVFIDGAAGTTGLRIADRLSERTDITLLTLPEDRRKDPEARKEIMNTAHVVFLCLPDEAAIEAVGMIGPDVCVIDTSTAHRTTPGWVYGFPELRGQTEKIASSKRIANPGCHASGFISLVAPLVQCGVLSPDEQLSCFSLTGYSGGGKKMIAEYEAPEPPALFSAPRVYGLSQNHKHLPEMRTVCGLSRAPVFSPIVAHYYAGMQVVVPLSGSQVKGGIGAVREVYKEYYHGPIVFFDDRADEAGFTSSCAFAGRDDMQIAVFGNEERLTLVSRFDNLGKGASGAAIQNMNILLGADATRGMEIGGKS